MNEEIKEKEIIKQIEQVNDMLEVISNELSFYDEIDDFKIELNEIEYKNCVDSKTRRKYGIMVTCRRSLKEDK